MRRIGLLVGVLLLALVGGGRGGPVEGPDWFRKRVEKGIVSGGRVTEPGSQVFSKTFAAGRRACVIAVGDHKPVVELSVEVFDSQGKLVAKDSGGEGEARDFVAAIWYPPREETYRILIKSYGEEYNDVAIAVK